MKCSLTIVCAISWYGLLFVIAVIAERSELSLPEWVTWVLPIGGVAALFLFALGRSLYLQWSDDPESDATRR